jgi:hypothetical protein
LHDNSLRYHTVCVFLKLRAFYIAKSKKGKRVNQKAATFFTKGVAGPNFRGKNKYEQLDDDSYQGFVSPGSQPMIPMTNTAAFHRRPTGFEQYGQVENSFSVADQFNDNDMADSTDLQRFVRSLSKILGANKFGLTFEFQNLRFHPAKAPRAILQDVSGCINAGSLWGVMGASGAGKCKEVLIYHFDLLTIYSYFCQCVDGQADGHHRYHQSQWRCW